MINGVLSFPGLEFPISDLSIDQKSFIAQMLNGKDTLGKPQDINIRHAFALHRCADEKRNDRSQLNAKSRHLP